MIYIVRRINPPHCLLLPTLLFLTHSTLRLTPTILWHKNYFFSYFIHDLISLGMVHVICYIYWVACVIQSQTQIFYSFPSLMSTLTRVGCIDWKVGQTQIVTVSDAKWFYLVHWWRSFIYNLEIFVALEKFGCRQSLSFRLPFNLLWVFLLSIYL